jgi:hypothetical protein
MDFTASWLLWLLFCAGQAIHVLKRAGMAVRSKNNPIATRREYLARHWDVLLIRAVLCAALFWFARTRPAFLLHLLSFTEGAAPATLPLDTGGAFVFGYFSDSVLDWVVSRVPVLQRGLPPTGETPVTGDNAPIHRGGAAPQP